MRFPRAAVPLLLFASGCAGAQPAFEPVPENPLEPRLRNVRKLTFGGENAEAYWSWDGARLVYQTTRGHPCDQIHMMDEFGADDRLVSTGLGRTTCSYFLPGDDEIVYSSTHHLAPECPTPPPSQPGVYTWPVFEYDVFRADADGSEPRNLTNSPGYDAESTVAPDGTIVFTSSRDGDLDIYSMRPDGSGVRRLTDTPGYDGGPFVSWDGKTVVYRAHHPETAEELAQFRELLGKGLVRPSRMSLWIMDIDGSNRRRLTNLRGASFCPQLHPDGKRVIFASNFEDEKGREFELYLTHVDGTGLERVTHTPDFDGFPMFSKDGRKLVWCSNRRAGKPRETDVFVADWVE
jgi:Tol biopolymer transport system component